MFIQTALCKMRRAKLLILKLVLFDLFLAKRYSYLSLEFQPLFPPLGHSICRKEYLRFKFDITIGNKNRKW